MTRERAWEYLLNVLSRQAYTVAELRTKLERKKVDDGTAEELLSRLVELSLVDDDAYAERYVAGRRATHGRIALRRELARRGVDEEVAAPHVESLEDAQQAAAAAALLRKNAWRYRPSSEEADTQQDGPDPAPDGVGRRRLAGPEEARRRAEAKARAFLARRGFDPDAVQAAIDDVGWYER